MGCEGQWLYCKVIFISSFRAFGGKGWISDKSICRTALATPGLLIILNGMVSFFLHILFTTYLKLTHQINFKKNIVFTFNVRSLGINISLLLLEFMSLLKVWHKTVSTQCEQGKLTITVLPALSMLNMWGNRGKFWGIRCYREIWYWDHTFYITNMFRCFCIKAWQPKHPKMFCVSV